MSHFGRSRGSKSLEVPGPVDVIASSTESMTVVLRGVNDDRTITLPDPPKVRLTAPGLLELTADRATAGHAFRCPGRYRIEATLERGGDAPFARELVLEPSVIESGGKISMVVVWTRCGPMRTYQ